MTKIIVLAPRGAGRFPSATFHQGTPSEHVIVQAAEPLPDPEGPDYDILMMKSDFLALGKQLGWL